MFYLEFSKFSDVNNLQVWVQTLKGRCGGVFRERFLPLSHIVFTLSQRQRVVPCLHPVPLAMTLTHGDKNTCCVLCYMLCMPNWTFVRCLIMTEASLCLVYYGINVSKTSGMLRDFLFNETNHRGWICCLCLTWAAMEFK